MIMVTILLDPSADRRDWQRGWRHQSKLIPVDLFLKPSIAHPEAYPQTPPQACPSVSNMSEIFQTIGRFFSVDISIYF